MLKADKTRIVDLASDDEAARVRAADELDALDIGHFEDHPVSRKFVLGLHVALLRAYRQTSSALVREWVVQVLADAQVMGKEVETLVKEALQPDCGYLPTLLYYIGCDVRNFHDCKERIKALCRHDDDEVRWRCVYVLEKLPLDYGSDASLLRSLMVDPYYCTRTYAVLSFQKLKRVEQVDREVLHEVVRIDDGAAKAYAMMLLAANENP